jgi:hypothetical protein
MEIFKTPTEIPKSQAGVKARLLEYSVLYRDYKNSDSWDKQRLGRQALIYVDKLLDFYPNGSPRDHLAAYSHNEGYHTPAVVPEASNVVLGQE